MEDAPEISLRQAAAAFGPCAGGTDNALRIITDRLKDDDLFWREIVADAISWDSPLITTEVPPAADWFRKFFDLTIQQSGKADPEFVDFHSQITSLLYDTDDLVVDYDEVRSIWVQDDYAGAYSQIGAKTKWTFFQALAWVATRDRNVVNVALPTKANATGWLTCLVAERCRICESDAHVILKWRRCQCMASALRNLTTFARKQGHIVEPELMVSIEIGTVELVGLPTAPPIMFDAAKVIAVFPEKRPNVTSIKRGRPKTAHLAIDLILQKMADGTFTGNVSALARLIASELAELYANTDIDPPQFEAIRQEIRRLIRKKLKPE